MTNGERRGEGGAAPSPDGPAPADPEAADGGDAGEPLPNLAVRVWELLTAPGRLFDRLRERPAWIGALVLMIAVAVASTWIMPAEVLREAASANMPADASPDQVESAVGFARIAGYIGSVVGPPVAVAVVAGVLLFAFNVVLGGAARYVQLFSVTVHAMLITSLGGIVVLPLVVSSGDPTTALALDLLVPGLEEGFLYRFLHGLNVFGLWAAALLALAVSRIYPRRTFGGAAAVVLSLYVGTKVLWAVLAGLGGA